MRRSGEERVIELDPLDADAVVAVLDGTLVTPNPQSRLRGALLERADGNPFYLASFLRSLVDDGSAITRRRPHHTSSASRRSSVFRTPCTPWSPSVSTGSTPDAKAVPATGLGHRSPVPRRKRWIGSPPRAAPPRRRRRLGR